MGWTLCGTNTVYTLYIHYRYMIWRLWSSFIIQKMVFPLKIKIIYILYIIKSRFKKYYCLYVTQFLKLKVFFLRIYINYTILNSIHPSWSNYCLFKTITLNVTFNPQPWTMLWAEQPKQPLCPGYIGQTLTITALFFSDLSGQMRVRFLFCL